MSRPNRRSLTILMGAAVCAGALGAVAVWVVPGMIESAWRGESVGFVNDILGGRADHALEEYLAEWGTLWPGLLLDVLGLGAAIALLARPETWVVLRRAFGASLFDVFHATPKLMICVALLSLTVGEFYPLSPFPMYSNFESEGAYVILTDDAGEPIAASARVGMGLDAVKKIFQANLKEERERRGLMRPHWSLGGAEPKDEIVEAAAARTLRYLRDARLEEPEALELWRERITLRAGALHLERELLGEVAAE